MDLKSLGLLAISAATISSGSLFAFEDATVLPKGIRRVMVTSVHTEFSERTTSNGSTESIAKPLEKEVTFKDFVGTRKGLDRTQLASFLSAYGIDESESVGSITTDMKAKINVFAPSFSLGFSEKLSIGFVIPIYDAQTDVNVGFAPNSNADKFANLLNDPATGQSEKVEEAVNAINGVVGTLNQKLSDNGYQKLGSWASTGLGDVMLKAKYQSLNSRRIRMATNAGFYAPTGQQDDPDILTDIGFGDGTWDPFLGIVVDEGFWGPIFLNQYAQYTAQLPAQRSVRMKTADEPITAEKRTVTYDLGDKIDAGASIQADAKNGVSGGLGYAYFFKFKDNYNAGKSTSAYEADTQQSSQSAEAFIGYSSTGLYRSGVRVPPFQVLSSYQRQLRQRQLQSRNMPVADRILFEAKLYF
jgi:hypothetical protein